MQCLDVTLLYITALWNRESSALKRFQSNRLFCEQVKVFTAMSVTQSDVIAAGEQALMILYNGEPEESLDAWRYKLFTEKVATNTTCVLPQTLPPTSAAAKYHSLRVYFQIQEWNGCDNEMQPVPG